MSDSVDPLRELFNARLDALQAQMGTMTAVLEKENIRLEETMERFADRTTPLSQTSRIEDRIETLERRLERTTDNLDSVVYKVRITWYAGGVIVSAIGVLIVAYVQKWIGL